MKNEKEYCPICRKEFDSCMGKLPEYWFCRGCLLGRVKVIPKIFYKNEYYVSGSNLLSKLFSPVSYMFFIIRNSYAGFSKKNVWIDVGAGEGNYLKAVKAEKKIGVEISRAGRKVMKRKGLSVMTSEEFMRSRNLQSDVISFWHVLEHVSDPVKYIRSAKENLRKSGKIVIAVPNIDSFELKLFGKYWFHLSPQYHIWFFSPKSMTCILKDAGLTVEKIDYWAMEHHLAGIMQTVINASTLSDNKLHRLLRRRQGLANVSLGQGFWIIFWCTFGLLFVVLFWIIGAIFKRPGAFVVVATDKNTF